MRIIEKYSFRCLGSWFVDKTDIVGPAVCRCPTVFEGKRPGARPHINTEDGHGGGGGKANNVKPARFSCIISNVQ